MTGYDVHRVDAAGTEEVGSATGASCSVAGLGASSRSSWISAAR
ncbi:MULTISPECIES: hypothetical protein [Micromonospora]